MPVALHQCFSPGATQPLPARATTGDGDFFPGGHLQGEREIGIEDEACAVEDKFVLAAELVDVSQRQTAFADARQAELQAGVELVEVKGRTVGDQQQFGAGLFQTFDDIGIPDVLADRDADADAANVEGSRHLAAGENARLVEDRIVRQVDLEAMALDLALVEMEDRVVELAALDPGGADQHCRAAIGRLAGKLGGGGHGGALESRLQHQILGRVAGQKQFGKDDEIGARQRGLAAGGHGLFDIARDVADDGV